MFSLIICSRTHNLSSELKENIGSTIGSDYELIVVDNSQNDYSIFTAYNEGIKRSRGDILCFMHDDILFHTSGWGSIVKKHFDDETVGLIGVEGTHYMPGYSAPWWASGICSGQLIQGREVLGNYESNYEQLWDRKEKDSTDAIDAVIVDGLWMCIRRSLFDSIRFDDIAFNNFHCYDMDICLQVLSVGKRVRVAYDVLIEHKSIGNVNSTYFYELHKWYEKWHETLPITKGIALSEFEQIEIEKASIRYADMFKSNMELCEKIESVYNSKAYRLGKFLLKPFKLFKKK